MSTEQQVIRLAQALSGQWTVPILLAMDRVRGRFTPLQHELQIAPARLSDNLKRMTEAGLVTHLSPHERRHPALPEYVLTEHGLLLRDAAQAQQAAEQALGYGRLSAKAWSMPVLLALHYRHERFNQIAHALEQVTPRMLSKRLDELHSLGAVDKQLDGQARPSFLYGLERASQPPVRQLAVDLVSIV
ncbi:winged helix-turn-helix transcriptional regulator [Paenibacillus sp. 1P07SE]|uniref:winged helix-turn-helix transcriptional regulator n=1 Tax=Paenibacillus sp. 1P07SE TaxID=3132209 RepID=UPI0039A5B1FD